MTLVQHPPGDTGWQPDTQDLEPVDAQSIDGDRDRARVLTRVRHASELRLMGLSWTEVAQRAGYASKGSAWTAVMGYLRRQADESVADLREQESARLDRAAVALWPKVLRGEARAQDTWLRNRAAFRALHGLNAPVQVSLSSGAEAGLRDALAEAEAMIMGMVGHDGATVVTGLPDDPTAGWDQTSG